MRSTIFCLRVARSDESKLTEYSALLANGHKIMSFLTSEDWVAGAPRHGFFFDKAASVASYATATAGTLFCMSVIGIDEVSAELVDSQLDDVSRMTLPAFQDIV